MQRRAPWPTNVEHAVEIDCVPPGSGVQRPEHYHSTSGYERPDHGTVQDQEDERKRFDHVHRGHGVATRPTRYSRKLQED